VGPGRLREIGRSIGDNLRKRENGKESRKDDIRILRALLPLTSFTPKPQLAGAKCRAIRPCIPGAKPSRLPNLLARQG
jgi:hypothetical protein